MRQTVKFAIIHLLRAYKWAISPLFPPSCRYVPTCSEYAMEAIDRHGAIRGSVMAIWRLLRCHPFVKGGYDPVPKTAISPWGSTVSHSGRSEVDAFCRREHSGSPQPKSRGQRGNSGSAFPSSASLCLRGETNLASHPNPLAMNRTVH